MAKTIRLKFLQGTILLSFFLFAGEERIFSAEVRDVLPEGASAAVITEKIKKDAEEQLLQPVAPKPVVIEEEKTPEQEISGPTFFVRDFILEGDVLIPPEQYQPILEKFRGKTIDFEQLQKLIGVLEQVFRSQGYIAVVLLPPQKMANEEIRLKAVVSRMGDLSVANNRYFSAWRTRSYWKIRPGQVLSYDRIRKGVLDMNENPNRTVKPILKAGKAKGTSDIVLNVEDHFPIHAGYTFDNQGVKLTGKERQGFTIRNNNLLGLDDIFLIGTNFGNTFGALYLYYIVPVTDFGTKLISSYSHAQVTPHKEYKIYGINSLSDTASLAVQQRVIRTDKYSGTAQMGLDYKTKHTLQQSVTTVWDKQWVLSLRGDFQARDQWGGWATGHGVYFGMPNRGNGWALASRQGNHKFFKYTFGLTRFQKLFYNTKAIWDFQGQLTPNRLLSQEQMFLGGAKSVRGYPESDYGADQAIQSRFDYLVPAFFFPEKWRLPWDKISLKNQIDLIGFFDIAYGRVWNPSLAEKKDDFLMGTGAGFQIRFRDNITGRFEWGVPLGDRPLTEAGDSQFHFSLNTTY